jgi:hypothetical protein
MNKTPATRARGSLAKLPVLPTKETTPPRTALGRWFFSGGGLGEPQPHEHTYPWYRVVWLTGVDYFSTLAYQPGIALLAAGVLSPSATLILVVVTLIGALPVYAEVARRSYAGQGSIAILEHLLPGWKSKIFVLVLLGFAATDFVLTMTLSAADAARHAIGNPYLHPYVGNTPVVLTLGLLTLLTLVFVIGFQEAIGLAAIVAIPYVLLNGIVLGAGLRVIWQHPVLLGNWRASLHVHNDWTGIFLVSAIIFPKLALGLSGFETGVSVMPLISGEQNMQGKESEDTRPMKRIQNTRKLLAFAALLMGVFLLASSFVTTLLIPEAAYRTGGIASGRAPAYLAHQLLGNVFGSIYDICTIAILWFAGASAMAGLINLIPRYLPRFGMAPRWVAYRRPMVLVLFVIDGIVTLIFRANVEAQGGAYATGVLVLILSAAIAVTIGFWSDYRGGAWTNFLAFSKSGYFGLVSVLFAYTLIANVFERPDGVYISAAFVFTVLTLSAMSRYQRSRELRVSDLIFADDSSAALWPSLVGKKVHMVPVEQNIPKARLAKIEQIQKHYQVKGPFAFLHVILLDNRSEFIAPLRVSVRREEEQFVIVVRGAVAVANSIAYMSELIDPISIFLELTRQNMMMQSLRYLFWGEGEIGLMVYSILVRYWEWAHTEGESHPTLYLMSS